MRNLDKKNLLLVPCRKSQKGQHQDLQNVLKTPVNARVRNTALFQRLDGPGDDRTRKHRGADKSELNMIQKKSSECFQLLGQEELMCA